MDSKNVEDFMTVFDIFEFKIDNCMVIGTLWGFI